MKISHLQFTNFQMLTSVDVTPTAPILLFAGANEQGKSSAHDAIRMAIRGISSRVTLKKDYGQLVRDGSAAGNASVAFADGRTASISLPEGKLLYSGGTNEPLSAEMIGLHSACLPLVIDPHLFSGMDANERRTLLFKLSGLKCDGKAVADRMVARGCDPKKVEAITPMLRSGFSAAHDEAREKAKSSRAMWKAITGEVYGEKKAETWSVDAQAVDQTLITNAQAALHTEDEVLGAAQSEVGSLESANAVALKTKAQLDSLQDMAGKKDRINKKLAVDKAELATWAQKVEDAKKLVGVAKAAPLACPHCAGLIQLTHGVLLQYEEPEQKFDPEAGAALIAAEKALALLTSAVSNGERDLRLSEDAVAQIAVLASADAPQEGAIMAAKVRVDTHKARRKELHDELDALNAKKGQAERAKEKTTKAAGFHADVKSWELLADALAPDGIQGELLADALTPFNNRLRDTSIATGWAQVQIDADMTLRVNGRLFSLLSKSATWRANAAIAETISYLSGLKFACFDECDILDIGNRSAFFKWLHRLAQAEQIDTVVCFGTFKALPGVPASTFDARWIERGEIVQQQAAA